VRHQNKTCPKFYVFFHMKEFAVDVLLNFLYSHLCCRFIAVCLTRIRTSTNSTTMLPTRDFWNRQKLRLVSAKVTGSHTHTHTCLMAVCPGLARWAGTRKVKPIRILLKQETVSGSDIGWAIWKSAPRSRQIITPASHHSVLLQAGCLPMLCCGWDGWPSWGGFITLLCN